MPHHYGAGGVGFGPRNGLGTGGGSLGPSGGASFPSATDMMVGGTGDKSGFWGNIGSKAKGVLPYVPLAVGVGRALGIGSGRTKVEVPELESSAPEFINLSNTLRQEQQLNAGDLLDQLRRMNASPSEMQRAIAEFQRGGVKLDAQLAQLIKGMVSQENMAQFEARVSAMNSQAQLDSNRNLRRGAAAGDLLKLGGTYLATRED